MLNPFFIQGTTGEQGLVQDIINEQLKIYGIEVYYMPREFISEGKIMKEVLFSKFSHAFPIEAYLANYEGFDTNSILMSKFGVRVSDEMVLIISKERFETYISELMKDITLVKNILRPNEGDLLYIPLSNSFMEIKYVENRKPFYQLQKNYVYELRCEVFEMEDEEIKTTVYEIDKSIKDQQYESTLYVSGIGSTATASTTLVNGGIQSVTLISGGYRYSSIPNVVVPSPVSGTDASLVGIITSKRGLLSSQSVSEILIQNPGSGYNPSTPPTISFYGGGGYGAQAIVGIATSGSIGPITITSPGQGYTLEPTVTISGPVSGGTTATAKAFLNSHGQISSIKIINSGYGYTSAPVITISAGSTVSTGNFLFNETITGSISNASGLVKSWDAELKRLEVTGTGKKFVVGDIIVGDSSGAMYIISRSTDFESAKGYDSSSEIQEQSDEILEFNEINPFGEV